MLNKPEELAPSAPESLPSEPGTISRRQFGRLAAVATAAAIAPGALLSQETAPARTPAATPDQPQSADGLSLELRQEGELKYQWMILKYGTRLSDAQKQDIHRLLMEGQKPLAAFRAFPLQNSDQPATVLKFTDAETSVPGGRS